MPQAVYILLGAAFTVAVSLAAGRILLRSLSIRLYRQEEHALAFVTGAACVSLLTFLLCAVGAARPAIFLAIGLAVLALAVRLGAHRSRGDSLPPLPPLWKWLFRSVFGVFSVLYFFHAMAPEMSPDGATYHLGLVSRYLRAHGFERITTNMYANISQGIEMLFLFAFAFGRHSAAALTHFAFLIALPMAMLSYARRFGLPAAGVCGALLVFTSPVVGMSGTVAYNDVATGCIVFTAFYLARIWATEEANAGLLVPLGLVAGFGYAAKYTAFLAVPYVLGVVGWKAFRGRKPILKPLAIVAGCAALMIAPWMVKNALWLDNPVSPFLNQVFPNPYIHVSFEKQYAHHMRTYDLEKPREIPLELVVRGSTLCGLLGPVFFLAPLGLLALRWPAGRTLLLAALIFLIPYPANIGTRFLIPALPFVALSMGLAVAGSSAAIVTLTLAHAILSWPPVIPLYSLDSAWRLPAKIPLRQALRIESEKSYLNFKMPTYGVAMMVEKLMPPGAKGLSFTGVPDAYTSREILVSYQSAFGNEAGDILWMPLLPDVEPVRLLRFRYPAQPLRQVRVVQTAAGTPDQWTVAELRVFRGDAELPRAPAWRLRARPNPWGVRDAFDNSPVTRWRSWQSLYSGMYLGVEFGNLVVSDSVLVESARDHYTIRLKLEGMDESGKWKTLSEAPEETEAPRRLGLRRAAAQELRTRGIGYLLMYDFDFGADDIAQKSSAWGVTYLSAHNGAKLYRID